MTKILVIEDDISIRQTIIELLESEDFKVYSATNGEEGINKAKEVLPDLIISDIVMPVKNGHEVLQALSGDRETDLIPFIFLSAKAERNDIREGMQLGADDYLIKPFKVDEILKAISTRLEKSRKLKAATSVDNHAELPKEKLNDEGHILVMVNDKPRFLKVKEIKCIIADAEYSKVYTVGGEKLHVRKLLKNWEESLPSSSFLRIHRSTIVNINFVEKIDKWFNNSFVVRIKDMKDDFVISRRYSSYLRNKLKVS